MIAQVVSKVVQKEFPFVDSLAQGFVLGVRAVQPEVRRYTEYLPYVTVEWPDQPDCRERLEVALSELGTPDSVGDPCVGGIAFGFVLGVLRASQEKVVSFPALVASARKYVWEEDPAPGLKTAAEELFCQGLLGIESMNSALERWRLWRRFRPG